MAINGYQNSHVSISNYSCGKQTVTTSSMRNTLQTYPAIKKENSNIQKITTVPVETVLPCLAFVFSM